MSGIADQLEEWFGLPPADARTLAALYEAKGAPIATAALAERARVAPGAVRWHVWNLRTALDCEALDREGGSGYLLSEVGLAEVEAAIREDV